MPLVKVLARGWSLDVRIEAVWTKVKGISSFAFGSTKIDAETKDFDSEGWDEHIVAGRGRTLNFEGRFLEDPETGDRDPGQEFLEDASDLIGYESLIWFKLTSPGGKIRYFHASVNLQDIGGGNDDPTSWGAELLLSGPPVDEEPGTEGEGEGEGEGETE